MRKVTILAFIILSILGWSTSLIYGQSRSTQESETIYYERKVYLKENIEKGWTQAEVIDIVGEPDRIVQNTQDNDEIEIWGYRGFEIRIEFRNGIVENWFFRFMP